MKSADDADSWCEHFSGRREIIDTPTFTLSVAHPEVGMTRIRLLTELKILTRGDYTQRIRISCLIFESCALKFVVEYRKSDIKKEKETAR